MLSKSEFKTEVSARHQQMGIVFGYRTVKFQAVLSAVKCQRRLVFLYGRLQPLHFLACHIRRIADQHIKRTDKASAA